MATALITLNLQYKKTKIKYFTTLHPVNRLHPQRLKLVKLSQSNNCIMNSLSKLYAWRSQRLFAMIFDLNEFLYCLNFSQFSSIIILLYFFVLDVQCKTEVKLWWSKTDRIPHWKGCATQKSILSWRLTFSFC